MLQCVIARLYEDGCFDLFCSFMICIIQRASGKRTGFFGKIIDYVLGPVDEDEGKGRAIFYSTAKVRNSVDLTAVRKDFYE